MSKRDRDRRQYVSRLDPIYTKIVCPNCKLVFEVEVMPDVKPTYCCPKCKTKI